MTKTFFIAATDAGKPALSKIVDMVNQGQPMTLTLASNIIDEMDLRDHVVIIDDRKHDELAATGQLQAWDDQYNWEIEITLRKDF